MQIMEIVIKEKEPRQSSAGCLGPLLFAGQFIGYTVLLIVLLIYMGFFV